MVIQVYTLTSNTGEAEVEWFFEDLQDFLELPHKKDVLFIIGGWNAKVGSQETPGATGKFGLGVWNEAGQRLIEICQENALVIANTLFQQHKGRVYTWTSPDGQQRNQIDYILCRQRWRSSIQSIKDKTQSWLWLRSWIPYRQIQTYIEKSRENHYTTQISSVQSLSRVPTLCDPMDFSTPGLPVYHQLLEFTRIHVHWVSDAIQLSHPLSSPSPPVFNLSQHQVFSNKSVLHIRWPKYWRFSFSISPSNEYSRLISFRMDWLDLLAVQGTLKSLFQHHSSKASILQHSAFSYSPTLTSIHDYWKNHSFD